MKNTDTFSGYLSVFITTSPITRIFLNNLPAYRYNLSYFLNGLEIGMAHGYFLLGPFIKLNPVRNLESANIIGFLSTIGIIFIISVGLIVYGKASFKTKNDPVFHNKYKRSNESFLFMTPLNYTRKKLKSSRILMMNDWNKFTGGFMLGASGGATFAFFILDYLS